jgi:hypothetical protein
MAHLLLLLQQIAVLVAEGAAAILADTRGGLLTVPEQSAGVATLLGDGHDRRAPWLPNPRHGVASLLLGWLIRGPDG